MIRMPINVTTATNGDTVTVCNDGTMWQLTGSAQWVEMPPIPQDESKDPLHKLYRENVEQTERMAELLHAVADVRKVADKFSATTIGRPATASLVRELYDALGAFAHPTEELPPRTT